jgi:hypothetical protein
LRSLAAKEEERTHHYFVHLSGAKPIFSAVLAVVLWPLVLLGVNLHIK